MRNVRIEPGIKTGKLDQACQRYNLGRNYMRQVAEDAGAVIRVGKSLLINFDKVDAYMDAISNKLDQSFEEKKGKI